MKRHVLLAFGAASMIAVSSIAMAHDPGERTKEEQFAECRKMRDMDLAKVDMSDPEMQSLMQQCCSNMKEMGHQDMGDSNSNAQAMIKQCRDEMMAADKKKTRKKHNHSDEK